MKWFKHESGASLDAKLQEVLLDYGLEGYGLYWYCLELIAGNVTPDNLTFELEHDARIIARNTSSTTQRVQEIMKRFVELGLFESYEGIVKCLKLAKKTDEYTAKLLSKSRQAPDKLPTVSGQNPEKSALLEEKRIDKKKKTTPKPTLDFSSWPELPSDQKLKDWKSLRRTKKAPISQTVVNTFGKELTKAAKAGFSVEQCFEQIITRSWIGFEAEWLTKNKNSSQPRREL